MTHDEMVEVILAHRDGRVIEYRNSPSIAGQPWQIVDDPKWNFAMNEYRIAKEPLEIWVNEYDRGLGELNYRSMEMAKIGAGLGIIRTIHFREVVE